MATTDDLSAELIKFNAFLASEEDQERQARAQKKALRFREEAAATLKQVNGNPKASKEEKDAAEAAWKAAIATEERVKAGGPLVEPGTEPEEPAASDDATASGSDETEATDDTVATEGSSEDEAPADTPADDDVVAADEAPADESPAPDAQATPEPPAGDTPADDAPPIDEPALVLADDVDVETDADRADAEPESPDEPAVVGDVPDDDVPPADQTEHPEAGSDAPAAG